MPVWNGLTDEFHPTQILADMLTMREHSAKPLDADRASPSWATPRNNMGNSLLDRGAQAGHGRPARRAAGTGGRTTSWSSRRKAIAAETGARITLTDDVAEGVKGADFLYTDVWVSMGEPHEVWAERIAELLAVPDQRRGDGARRATRTRSSCTACPRSTTPTPRSASEMLAEYGISEMEVTDEVFESPASIVFDQAENRMHTIKAILVATIGD